MEVETLCNEQMVEGDFLSGAPKSAMFCQQTLTGRRTAACQNEPKQRTTTRLTPSSFVRPFLLRGALHLWLITTATRDL